MTEELWLLFMFKTLEFLSNQLDIFGSYPYLVIVPFFGLNCKIM